jgi:hypothetical protein
VLLFLHFQKLSYVLRLGLNQFDWIFGTGCSFDGAKDLFIHEAQILLLKFTKFCNELELFESYGPELLIKRVKLSLALFNLYPVDIVLVEDSIESGVEAGNVVWHLSQLPLEVNFDALGLFKNEFPKIIDLGLV